MTTMFDAPMQDFSGDTTMDADMLPSTASDTDWLQVENMMEDGDIPRPLAEEVDMVHGDVQEFEMRDAGELEYAEDLDQMLSETAGHHFRAESQDQEIPDASRAPSPSTLISYSQPKTLTTSMRSDEAPQDPLTEPDPGREATQIVPHAPPSPSASQSYQGPDGSSTPLVKPPKEQKSRIGVDAATADAHDTSTVSEETNRSPHLQPQAESSEFTESGVLTGPLADHDHVVHTEPSHEEYPLPEAEAEGQPGVEPGSQAEVHPENQVTQEEDEGSLIDPPPTVLLSYLFDGSNFALFNLPEDSQVTHNSVSATIEAPTTSRVDSKRESDIKGATPSQPETLAEPEGLILLFRERFALYYEPLSLVFEALRADEAINTDGRFDHNIELVISAPELDLTLSEDNINAQEVSLHDLGVLHTGCDLSGPLSLRLDTISPRFGTRYKAIRDEIVRVVSQEEERRSQLDPADSLYTDGAPLNESPGDVQHETEVSSNHHHSDQEEQTDQSHEEPSKSQTIADENGAHERNASDSHRGKAEEDEDAEADGYEDTASGEYVEYVEYDEGQTGDGTEEIYEHAEEEYTAEEGESFGVGYEDTEAQYHVEEGEKQPDETQPATEEEPPLISEGASDVEATYVAFEHVYDYTADPGDGDPSTADVPGGHDSTPSTQYVAAEELVDAHALTSGTVANDIHDTPELDNNVHEVTPHENLLPTETFLNAEHLLSETPRPRSRSITPRPSTNVKHGQDEVIAYEDTVEDDEDDEQHEVPRLPTFSTSPSLHGSRAVSTASKRSYDEHELDQFEGIDPQRSASNESKRVRVD